jgi:hypothetical protein
MSENNEINKRFLRFCCTNLNSIGILMLIFGLLGGFGLFIVNMILRFGDFRLIRHHGIEFKMSMGDFDIFFWGLGILILVQFIKYLIEENYQPG